MVSDLANSGLEVSHPLLEGREKTERAILLVLTGNRGLCGGYNSNVVRLASARWHELTATVPDRADGNLGQARHRGLPLSRRHAGRKIHALRRQGDVRRGRSVLANRYLEAYAAGELDRLDVAYTRFESISRQAAIVETLLPLGSLVDPAARSRRGLASRPAERGEDGRRRQQQYEFFPSAASILEEVVPTSFKIKLFKCFLDAAVSEQIARMVAMKSATENADTMIKNLSRAYNRARQSQITGEIMEVLGGVEALKG